MYKKLIFATVLIAFVGVQIASSLDCHTCNTPTDCRYPRIVTCNNATANATSEVLAAYYTNVAKVQGSQRFHCLSDKHIYTNNNTAYVSVLGCVHPQVQACYLTLRPQYSFNSVKHSCYSCDGNRCNPAGTFSNSMFTIFGSIVALILVKIFAK